LRIHLGLPGVKISFRREPPLDSIFGFWVAVLSYMKKPSKLKKD
jgi:hypothetical protein